MKKTLTVALLLAACAFIISLVYRAVPFSQGDGVGIDMPTIELAGETIRVSIADSAEDRAKGLSGRAGLAPDEGMLFVFPENDTYSFWMKDMRFAIDIVWISHSGEIVDLRGSVSPESYPAVFTPRGEARYVVELPAGWASEHRLSIGDIVRL